MVDIIHRIGIKAPISKVYAALATVAGVAGWWTQETSGESKPGGALTFSFRNPQGEQIGKMVMSVVALSPEQRVHWRVTDGPSEWLGTDLTFELSQHGEQTILLFGHKNWREPVEFMAHCSMKWATFLLSLRDLVETGRGKPAPDDLKIDDWN
jgi:uncharacterized protein YndB with AHSA1/START domain